MASTRAAPFDDRRYQLEADVRTLAEARRIEGDSKRLKAAKAHARKMIAEQQQRLDEIAAVRDGDNERAEGE